MTENDKTRIWYWVGLAEGMLCGMAFSAVLLVGFRWFHG